MNGAVQNGSDAVHKKPLAGTCFRRAHLKAAAPFLARCADSDCDLPPPPHAACRHCGTYRGHRVLPPA
ncbi:50S ribosomal protein L32 [Streptomyces atratus]|uniref:50S ribosomal protein L32 n=1 Tax=Streptomyces atratus TaxID=1893 RepID=UPI0035713226